MFAIPSVSPASPRKSCCCAPCVTSSVCRSRHRQFCSSSKRATFRLPLEPFRCSSPAFDVVSKKRKRTKMDRFLALSSFLSPAVDQFVFHLDFLSYVRSFRIPHRILTCSQQNTPLVGFINPSFLNNFNNEIHRLSRRAGRSLLHLNSRLVRRTRISREAIDRLEPSFDSRSSATRSSQSRITLPSTASY